MRMGSNLMGFGWEKVGRVVIDTLEGVKPRGCGRERS